MFEQLDNEIRVYRVHYENKGVSKNLYVSPNFKLCMVTSGEALWQIGAKNLSVKKDDIVILNNQQKRVFKSISQNEGIEMIVIEFPPQKFMSIFEGIFFNMDEVYESILSGQLEMQWLFKEIEDEAAQKKSHYQIIQEAKTVEILTLIGRKLNLLELENEKKNRNIYQALAYINENYRTDISMKHVTELVHMSESQFSRHFMKCTGMGFAQYVMQRRIGYAIEQLQGTDKTVLEIALESGYNSSSCFYKAFRKLTHLSPKDYRK